MISCKNLTIKKGQNFIVKDISLNLARGEITTVLGANGAGKSSLLKALCGFEKVAEGEIYFYNHPIQKYSLESLAKIRAVMSQQSSIDFPFRVIEVVLMGRHPFIGKEENSKDKQIAELVLRKVDAYNLRDRIYSTLSGGEQQRVQFARALAQIWEVLQQGFLFLDEPVSSLDLKHQYMLLQELKILAKNGLGIFCILHDLNLAKQFSDKILMMKAGKIFKLGKTADIFNQKNLRDLFEVEDEFGCSYLQKICHS